MTWDQHTSSTHEHKRTSWAHIMDPWRADGEGDLLERRMRAQHATIHAVMNNLETDDDTRPMRSVTQVRSIESLLRIFAVVTTVCSAP